MHRDPCDASSIPSCSPAKAVVSSRVEWSRPSALVWQLSPLRLAVCLVVSGHSSTQTRMHVMDWTTYLVEYSSLSFPRLCCLQQARPAPCPRPPLTTSRREALCKVLTSLHDCVRAARPRCYLSFRRGLLPLADGFMSSIRIASLASRGPGWSWNSRHEIHKSPPRELDRHDPSGRGVFAFFACVTMWSTLACPLCETLVCKGF